MDTTGPETSLDNLKASAFSEHNAVQGDADVLEDDVTVTVRRIIISKYTEHTMNRDTGCVGWNQHNRLLLVHALVVRV